MRKESITRDFCEYTECLKSLEIFCNFDPSSFVKKKKYIKNHEGNISRDIDVANTGVSGTNFRDVDNRLRQHGECREFGAVRCLTVFCHGSLSSPFFNRLSSGRRSVRPIFFWRPFASGIPTIGAIHPSANATGDLSRKSPWDSARVFDVYRRIRITCYLLGRPGYTAPGLHYRENEFPRASDSPGTTNLNNRQLDSYGTCVRPISKETAFLV